MVDIVAQMLLDVVEQVVDGRGESLWEMTRKGALMLRKERRKIQACLDSFESAFSTVAA
jgi:ligand-binding sensor domain-containing protein